MASLLHISFLASGPPMPCCYWQNSLTEASFQRPGPKIMSSHHYDPRLPCHCHRYCDLQKTARSEKMKGSEEGCVPTDTRWLWIPCQQSPQLALGWKCTDVTVTTSRHFDLTNISRCQDCSIYIYTMLSPIFLIIEATYGHFILKLCTSPMCQGLMLSPLRLSSNHEVSNPF